MMMFRVKRLGLLLTCLSIIFTVELSAQEQLVFSVEQTYGRKLGHTQPLRDLISAARTNAERIAHYKANRPREVVNFKNSVAKGNGLKSALPFGQDPLIQDFSLRAPLFPSDPIVVAEGLSFIESLVEPPDVNGDVSDKYYVEVVNATTVQVFDQLGNRVGDPFQANTIWEQVGHESAGDPIILYDQDADRWILTEIPPRNRVLLAISDTDDPLGSWTAYALNTVGFPDYPKYGIWPETYLLTVNEIGSSETIFYGINRDDILNGNDVVKVQRFGVPRLDQPGIQSVSPVGWIGDIGPASHAKPMVVRINDDAWGNTETDQLDLFEVDINWDNPDSSNLVHVVLPTSPFSADFCEFDQNVFVCVPQPGPVSISGIPRIIWNKVSYRNFEAHSSVVLNFGVDVTGKKDAGIRWMELRKEGEADWYVYQEGTIGSTDGENRFLGGISIDEYGNIGIGYAVSSEVTYPSLRYTGRLAADPIGIMTIDEVEIATGVTSSRTPRYGDYQSMSIDRQNVFWFAGQYLPECGLWSTKIAAFRLQRQDKDIGIRSLVQPVDAPDLASETVSLHVTNFGNLPLTEFVIGYVFEDTDPVIDTVVIDTLRMDSSYVHTFAEQITFDRFGPHSLLTFTSLKGDENSLNDSCAFTITKTTRNDASIYAIDGINGVSCDTFNDALILLMNKGVEPLTSCGIIYAINGLISDTLRWTGDLRTGEINEIAVTFEDLNLGTNHISIAPILPNGMVDEYLENDTLNVELDVMIGGGYVRFELTTELFPAETSWELFDSNYTSLATGGPFDDAKTLYIEEWCLDYEQCYTLVVSDTAGDGMRAYGVQGDFEIINEDGFIVASLQNPSFGDADTTDFCLKFSCTLRVVPFVTNESLPGASNGIINLFTSGGSPSYLFSNDNGINFQSSPIFSRLAPGVYQCIVRDASNCEEHLELIVLDCRLQVVVEVTEASSADTPDGTIFFMASDGRGTLKYSIDGGATFQLEPFFEGLLPDTIAVQVRDSLRCKYIDTVIIDFATSIESTFSGQLISVFPNPSDGVFNVHVTGLPGSYFVTYQVLDSGGRIVRTGEAGNFNGVLKATFALNTDPAGIYYLRFLHPELNRLVKLVKY